MRRDEIAEACRYLGYRGSEPPPETAEAVRKCLRELEEASEPRTVYRRFPVTLDGDLVTVEGMEARSRALARNLRGCSEVYLMAATLGMAPDRLTARAQAAGKMSRAVILQAAAAALIERVCDELNDRIREEARAEGSFLRPRFSPGYGDFSLEHQEELFRILEVQKRIGVTLTESLLMIPSKSVTAVIGVSGSDSGCAAEGCESCGKTDCSFRRN